MAGFRGFFLSARLADSLGPLVVVGVLGAVFGSRRTLVLPGRGPASGTLGLGFAPSSAAAAVAMEQRMCSRRLVSWGKNQVWYELESSGSKVSIGFGCEAVAW